MSYKSGETVYGGALVRSGWVIASDAYVNEPDCKVYNVNGRGGKVYDTDVLSGGTINNTVVGAHASGSYGYLENIRLSGGGTVIVRSAGNVISSGAIYGGTLYVQSSATADAIKVFPNGKVVCSDGRMFNVEVSGGATNKLVDLQGNAYVKGMTVVGIAQATNYVYLSHTAVLEDLTVTSASVYLAGGGTLRNFTMYAAGTPVLRGEQTYCSGATVYGGNLHFQNGAKGDSIVVNGAKMYVHDNGNSGIPGSGAYVSGVDIIAGGLYVSAGGRVDGLRASGGTVTVNSTTGSFGRGATLSGAVFTGGQLTLGAGAVAYATDIGENAAATVNGTLNAVNEAYNITQAAGTVNIAATARGGNIVQNGGTLSIAAGAEIDGVTYNAGTFEVSAGATLKNFYKNGTTNINLRTGATVDGGALYTAYLQALNNNNVSGATIKNYTVYGGLLIVRGAANVASNIRVSGGGLCVQQAGASGVNVDVYSGGALNLNNGGGAFVSSVRIHSGGVINGKAANHIYRDITVESGGAWTLQNGFVSGADVAGATVTLYGQYIYVSGGATFKDVTFAGDATAGEDWVYITDPFDATSGGAAYDQMLLGNTTVSSGALIRLLGTNVHGSGATVYGKYYVQNGATLSGATIHDGGVVNMYNSADFNDAEARARTVGATIKAGGSGAATNADFFDVTAEAGAGLALNDNAGLGGAANTVAAGTLYVNGTLDEDAATDENHVLRNLDVSDVTLNFKDGVVLGDMSIDGGATVNFEAGARGADIEAMGGTLNVAATAELDGADIGGATVNVASGAVARDLEVNAGRLNVEAGADVDGVTYNGGTFSISSGATIKNLYKIAGGTVNMYGNAVVDGGYLEGGGYLQALAQNGASGAVIRNYELRGGAADLVIVRAGGNRAENIAVYGGALHVQSGASASGVDVYDGGTITTPDAGRGGATLKNIRIHAGGTGVFAANAARAMNIDGLTMDEYAAATFSSANVADFNATGGEVTLIGQKNYVSGGGTLEDITVLGNGYLYINDPYNAASGGAAYAQMVNRNLTVEAGAMVLMHGTNVCGSGAQVWGKYYVQNGATLSGGTVHDGGYVNMWQRADYNDFGVRAKTVGVTVSAGGSVSVDNSDVFDMTTEAGALLSLDANAGIGGNANNIAAGTLKIDGAVDADAYTDENHVLRNVNVSAQTLNLRDGIALKDLSIGHAGRIYAYDTTIEGLDIEAPDQTNVGRLYLSSGTVVSGGRVNGSGGATVVYMTEGATFDDAHVSGGNVFLSANAEITNIDLTGGAVILRGSDTYASGAVVSGGALHVQNGGKADDITVAGGKLIAADTQHTNPAGKVEVVNNVTMLAGQVEVSSGATINKLHATGGKVYVFSSGTVNVGDGGSVNDLQTVAGAKVNFVENKNVATFTGENTNIAEGTLYFFGSAVAGHAANGVIEGFNADGSTVGYKLSIGSGIVLKDVVGNNTAVRVSAFDGAVVSGITLRGGAIICVNGADARVYDATLTGEMSTCNLNLSAGAYASNTVVRAGGKIQFQHADAKADNTTIMAGGSMVMTAAADTGDRVTLDFTGTTGNQRVYITNLGNVKAETEIVLVGGTAGNTYTIANTGAADRYVNCDEWGLYDDRVKAGETLTNAFTGMTYEFNAAGTAITVSGGFVAATQAAAAKLADGATTLNGNDKAAKWDSATAYTSNVFLADGMSGGNAWLDIDGFAASNANVYGTAKDQNFTGIVNIDADNGAIKNLAAGAGLGGKVAGVKLTVGDGMNVGGAVYAGGMGDVTGKTETLVEGGEFTGNVFAGALCNYAANATATSAGNIDLTVNDGTFAGNIYAGAAIKAGAATTTVHSAGDITVELNGGTALRQTFCVYGGGYATGTAEDAPVYTAGDVDITVNGGTWGTYLSGRGIFGGVYADKVAASVDSVAISVTGGTMGNIYGGGWAQNNGTSTVTGLVNITVSGDAEVNNVFGGGSYSGVSGGATSVGSVNITVDGGDIKNNIFAAGQNEYSTVAGDVSVVFTGSNDYACNVYGYGVQASATVGGDRTLAFDGYTGTLSGAIGGFDGIVVSGDTAAALSGTTIDNDDWSFDYTGRTLGAATAMLTFDGGSLTGDNVSVNLSGVGQAAGGWSIAAGLTAADATFGVELATGSASGLALGDTLDSSYGSYEGWGFTFDADVLKFKQLA